MRPRARCPTAKPPSSFTRNHAPNSVASVSARQTLERGARSVIRFSILSVSVFDGPLVMGNLLVAYSLSAGLCATRRLPFATDGSPEESPQCPQRPLRNAQAGRFHLLIEAQRALAFRCESRAGPTLARGGHQRL